MYARMTAYLPYRAASVRTLNEAASLRIGRSPDCELQLEHGSVSRAHAELVRVDDAWRIRDLKSKNGVRVNGEKVEDAALPESAWLRFGDVDCHFASLSEGSVEEAARVRNQRKLLAEKLTYELGRLSELPQILADSLRAALQLGDCESGFLLQREGDGWRVRAQQGFDMARFRRAEFREGANAVQRALGGREPVVVNRTGLETAGDTAAGEPPFTQIAMPLMDGDRPVGLIYLESRRPGAVIAEWTYELLTDFAGRAALWMSARRSPTALAQLSPQDPDWRVIARLHESSRM